MHFALILFLLINYIAKHKKTTMLVDFFIYPYKLKYASVLEIFECYILLKSHIVMQQIFVRYLATYLALNDNLV